LTSVTSGSLSPFAIVIDVLLCSRSGR
jgi:hypothetical protein